MALQSVLTRDKLQKSERVELLFAQERLVTRTDGSLPWCCLPHIPIQVCYDGPRERCAPLVPAIVSQQGGKPDEREHGTIRQ